MSFFGKNFLRGHFFKVLPTAAALSLPYTDFLPSAPTQKFCRISPLRKKFPNLLIIKSIKWSRNEGKVEFKIELGKKYCLIMSEVLIAQGLLPHLTLKECGLDYKNTVNYSKMQGFFRAKKKHHGAGLKKPTLTHILKGQRDIMKL